MNEDMGEDIVEEENAEEWDEGAERGESGESEVMG